MGLDISISYISTSEAAGIIGCTRGYVSDLLLRGELVGRRFGTVWMVDRESAERYAALPPGRGRPRKNPPQTPLTFLTGIG